MSEKSLDLLISHAYHFKIALQRDYRNKHCLNGFILRKWTSLASKPLMSDIVKLGKSIKKHLEGKLEAIRSEINSVLVKGLNTKTRKSFKRSYRFKAQKYRDTIIYLVAGGLKLPSIN